jgi:hypothetical protein
MERLARKDGLVQRTRLIPAALRFVLPRAIQYFVNGLNLTITGMCCPEE